MGRLLMLKEKKAWKQEFGFDRIKTAAEMDEQRFRSSLVSDPFFYRNMSNPRHPHTSDEFILEMKVDIEQLRMEIILSQPALPQCDPLPPRVAVNTGSEEPGTPRRLPTIGTGSDEPGVWRFETSVEEEGILPLETSMDRFLHVNFTSPKQECIMFQQDVGVDDSGESITSKVQADPGEEFARLPIGRQQRKTASTEENEQFERGRSKAKSLRKRGMFCRIYCMFAGCYPFVFVCFLSLSFSCRVRNMKKQVRKDIGAIGMYQMRELLYHGRSVHHLDLRNEGYSLYRFAFWMLHYENRFFFLALFSKR